MNYQFSVTYPYKVVHPDVNSFNDFLEEFTIVTPEEYDSVFLLYMYIRNRYYNSSINYDTINAFNRNFGITFSTLYKQYLKRVEFINATYDSTVEEVRVVSMRIQNHARNDGSLPVDPLDVPLNFVDNQLSEKMLTNRVDMLVNSIYKMTDLFIEDFIDEFSKHFTSVHFNDVYVL